MIEKIKIMLHIPIYILIRLSLIAVLILLCPIGLVINLRYNNTIPIVHKEHEQ